MLFLSQFVLSLVMNTIPENKYIPQQYQECSIAVQSLVLALHALHYTSLNKRSYRLSALTRVIILRKEQSFDAQAISQNDQCSPSLVQDLVDSIMAYFYFNQLFWIVHQFRERKSENERIEFLEQYKTNIELIKKKLLSDHHNQAAVLELQMGELVQSIRLAEERQETDLTETLKLQEKLLEKKLSLIKQHVLLLPFPDLADTNKLLSLLIQK